MPAFSPYPADSVQLTECAFTFFKAHACTYDLLSHTIYFSLGEAIGAVALFFTAYQLSKPSWRIISSIRPWWQRWLPFALLALGLLSILLSALVTEIPIYILSSPYNHPILYEVTGFVLFLVATLSYIIFSSKAKGIFGKWNYEKFYQVILNEIAKATPETIEACVNIIKANLSQLAESAKKNKDFVFLRTEEEREEFRKPERVRSEYARAVLDTILSEKKVAVYIANGRLDFLFHFISEVKRNDLTKRSLWSVSESLLKCLFEDRNSHLYNQLRHGGLSVSANLYEVLFYDQKILDNLDTLDTWNSYLIEDEGLLLEEKYLKVYLKALENALEGYWFSPAGNFGHQSFNSGFRNLGDYARRLVYFANQDATKMTQAVRLLNSIANFSEDIFIRKYEKAVQENKATSSDINVDHDRNIGSSITAHYVFFLSEFLESLAMLDGEGEEVRMIALHASMSVLSGIASPSGEAFTNLRSVCRSLIWGKIRDNVEKGHFPAILRVYLSFMSFNSSNLDPHYVEERNKLITYLESTLKPKILAGEKMINDKDLMEEALLPKSVVFNRETGKFNWVMSGGSVEEIVVRPVVTIEG